MSLLALVVFLQAAAPAPTGSGATADPGCVSEADRPTFCEVGTVWSAGPCDGGEYLVCEPANELPNISSTVFLAIAACGIALPPLMLAASVVAVSFAIGALVRSLDPNAGLDATTTDRLRVASAILTAVGVLGTGAAFTALATGVMSAFWLWRQGLEVVEKNDGAGRRVTLYATTGLGRSSPIASYKTERERDCYDEIRRLASEDHFHKTAEIWENRHRSLIGMLDPWKGTPRLPDRTPANARMTLAKCQAQMEGGAARVKQAMQDVARMQDELRKAEERAREDLRQCAMKTSTCTCNCDSRGGAGGAGGVVSLGPTGTPQQLFARLAEALGPEVKVTEKDGTIHVPLKETVLFEWDKDVLTPSARATLNKVAKVLAGQPDLQIIVEGHTSAPGATDYNFELSQRRVKAVVDALASMGVGKNQMTTGSYGETRPELRTEAEEGRNRRVVIRLK